MSDLLYQVKEGVTASVFDDGNLKDGQASAYIIYYESRYWKVSPVIYQIYLCMKLPKTIAQIKEQMLEMYSLDIQEDKIEKIIEIAFAQNGLLCGTVAKSEKKRNKNLWGKFTLLTPRIIMKFEILQFFYKKQIFILMGISSLVWLAYILSSFSNSLIMKEMAQLDVLNIVICYTFILIAGIIHEFGHAMAALYGKSNPGRIGVGIYIVMPVMFSEVTDVWRLERKKRVLVDLGGIYFQGVFLMICYFLNYFVFHHRIWNIAILVSTFQIIGNLNPFIKLDGYWILADYLGASEIKDSVIQAWKDLFGRSDKKDKGLTKDKRTVIFIYSFFTAGFYVMFVRMLINSLILSIKYFHADIMHLQNVGNIANSISFSNVFGYLSSRFVSIITIIFFVRILFGIVKSVIKLLKKR